MTVFLSLAPFFFFIFFLRPFRMNAYRVLGAKYEANSAQILVGVERNEQGFGDVIMGWRMNRQREREGDEKTEDGDAIAVYEDSVAMHMWLQDQIIGIYNARKESRPRCFFFFGERKAWLSNAGQWVQRSARMLKRAVPVWPVDGFGRCNGLMMDTERGPAFGIPAPRLSSSSIRNQGYECVDPACLEDK